MNLIRITSLDDPQISHYTSYSENQLANIYAPAPGLFIAESPNVIERALNAGYEPVSLLTGEEMLRGRASYIIEEKLLKASPDMPIFVAEDEVLSGLRGFQLTRGVMCAMKRKTLASVEEVCKGARRIAVLEDVVNPTNVGAIIRSAAALNMDAVLLTSKCADPLYKRAARVSVGTIFQIRWTYLPKFDNIGRHVKDEPEITKPLSRDYVSELKSLGFKCAAMALLPDSLTPDSVILQDADKLAIILGTEGEGLSKDTINACDYTVCIPMAHGVDSLNVAAASAVAFYELGNK